MAILLVGNFSVVSSIHPLLQFFNLGYIFIILLVQKEKTKGRCNTSSFIFAVYNYFSLHTKSREVDAKRTHIEMDQV